MIDITKEELKEIANDLSDDIANESVWHYTEEWSATSEEATAMRETVAKVARKKILDVIGGFCH